MSKYSLPNMEFPFEIQVRGEESQLNWAGKFRYKRPTLYERSQIEVMKARLNGDLVTIDPTISAFNEAISHLRYTLIESPDWWKEVDYGGQLYDTNVVNAVYEKCIQFESEWEKRVKGGDAKDVADGKNQIIDEKSPISPTAR